MSMAIADTSPASVTRSATRRANSASMRPSSTTTPNQPFRHPSIPITRIPASWAPASAVRTRIGHARRWSKMAAGEPALRAVVYASAVPQDQPWDVAIIGAGPAGLAAALAAAGAGARTVVLERAIHPRYKTCGGGLIGTSLAVAG